MPLLMLVLCSSMVQGKQTAGICLGGGREAQPGARMLVAQAARQTSQTTSHTSQATLSAARHQALMSWQLLHTGQLTLMLVTSCRKSAMPLRSA